VGGGWQVVRSQEGPQLGSKQQAARRSQGNKQQAAALYSALRAPRRPAVFSKHKDWLAVHRPAFAGHRADHWLAWLCWLVVGGWWWLAVA
jgi:hypothetical protein